MTAVVRGVVVGLLVCLTVVLQISLFDSFAIAGVVPDVVMLVVIAAALVRGESYGAVVGFMSGLVLDLAPPADHTAGRWALAFVLVGYLTGLMAGDEDDRRRPSPMATLLTVAAGAFVGTSVFALTGLVLDDGAVTVGAAFRVVPVAVLYDLLLTPLVVPLVAWVFRRLDPVRRW